MTSYTFEIGREIHALDMVFVEGTGGRPYQFGEGDATLHVEIPDFYLSRFPVTQALWAHVIGSNPAIVRGHLRPVENVSWIEITRPGGFLDQVNAKVRSVGEWPDHFRLRLPSETEWEYSARGGPHWSDGFRFSGGNEINAVAWYKDNSGDAMHDVGQKLPNQLGLHDLSGNAWEWCQDSHTPDVDRIPRNGTPLIGESDDRVLRGGCFHNWAIHCTVSKRYEIAAEYRDGCIGFRLALST